MTDTLHLSRLPALWPSYLRGIFNGRPINRLGDATIPEMSAAVDGVVAGRERLRKFRELLGHPDDGTLPPTFPQVLASPMHLALLTRKAFPLRASGLVHLHNSVTVFQPIPEAQPLRLSATLSPRGNGAHGIEIDLTTVATADGEVVWSANALVLARRPGGRQRRSRSPRPSVDAARVLARWQAESDTGRRYAAVSGDYNPIHLWGLTARAFGFSSPIAHGMWTLGRAIAVMHDRLQAPFEIEARFRRPLLLPAAVRLLYEAGSPARFCVEDSTTAKAYLAGSVGQPVTVGQVS